MLNAPLGINGLTCSLSSQVNYWVILGNGLLSNLHTEDTISIARIIVDVIDEINILFHVKYRIWIGLYLIHIQIYDFTYTNILFHVKYRIWIDLYFIHIQIYDFTYKNILFHVKYRICAG